MVMASKSLELDAIRDLLQAVIHLSRRNVRAPSAFSGRKFDARRLGLASGGFRSSFPPLLFYLINVPSFFPVCFLRGGFFFFYFQEVLG